MLTKNLSIYSAWKRTTLDRMTAKFTNELLKVYVDHLKTILPSISKALERGDRDFKCAMPNIDKELQKVFIRHQRNVTFVAISDGIREVTPDKRLSTWENYNIGIPVENTFVNLAEKKERDSIFEKIDKIVTKKNKSRIDKLIQDAKEIYVYSVQGVFKDLAKDHIYSDDSDKKSIDYSKLILQSWFEKSKPQVEVIFRTETTRYFNDARIDYFKSETNSEFVMIRTSTDARTSNICECRKDYVIPLNRASEPEFCPPFHPNCRTIVSPLLAYLKSNVALIEKNLGSEFDTVHSDVADRDFKGQRKPPEVPIAWN